MARNKIDGVIEAVRYSPDGSINVVRTYVRRGLVWSDHILLDRTDLVERLNNGKRYVIGDRKANFGSVFNTAAAVHLAGGHIFTEGEPGARDLLTGVPVF